MANRNTKKLSDLEVVKLEAMAYINKKMHERRLGDRFMIDRRFIYTGPNMNAISMADKILKDLSMLYVDPTYHYLKRKINSAKSLAKVHAIMTVLVGTPQWVNWVPREPARRISQAAYNALGNPYTAIGRSRLKREFAAMSHNHAINQRRVRRANSKP